MTPPGGRQACPYRGTHWLKRLLLTAHPRPALHLRDHQQRQGQWPQLGIHHFQLVLSPHRCRPEDAFHCCGCLKGQPLAQRVLSTRHVMGPHWASSMLPMALELQRVHCSQPVAKEVFTQLAQRVSSPQLVAESQRLALVVPHFLQRAFLQLAWVAPHCLGSMSSRLAQGALLLPCSEFARPILQVLRQLLSKTVAL